MKKSSEELENIITGDVKPEAALHHNAAEENVGEVEDKQFKYVHINKAAESRLKHKKFVTVLLAIIILATLIGGAAYGILALIEQNDYRILIDRDGEDIFSLSEKANFAVGTQKLVMKGPRYMDNVTLLDFYDRIEEFKAVEGSYLEEGQNFMVATFYIKNVSAETQRFTEYITLSEVTRNVDGAVRIMCIRNDDITVYAKAKPNGEAEEVVPTQRLAKDGTHTDEEADIWYTTPFLSDKSVFHNTGLTLQSQEVIRYTLIVYLEGWDEQCVNSILGGKIKLEFHFAKE